MSTARSKLEEVSLGYFYARFLNAVISRKESYRVEINIHETEVALKVKIKTVLTVAEVAELLRVAPDTVYRLVSKGGIPHVRVGSIIRFDRNSIEAFLSGKKARS